LKLMLYKPIKNRRRPAVEPRFPHTTIKWLFIPFLDGPVNENMKFMEKV